MTSISQQEIVVWPDDKAPNVLPNVPDETFIDGTNFEKVTRPRLYAFPLPPESRNGVALLVCPGGGYVHVSFGWGKSVQSVMESQGVTVFILKYRLIPPSKQPVQDAMEDGIRAMQIIRSRAAGWGIDPNKIGIVGHSAGANLALNVATHIVGADPALSDPVLRVSSRPDFVALCSTWQIDNLDKFPIRRETTPPIIMFHAKDDTTAPFVNATKLFDKFEESGVSVESHWIDIGNHSSFGLRPGQKGSDWLDIMVSWLRQMNLWSTNQPEKSA